SALDGSNGLVKLRVTLAFAYTGPELDRVAVGATLLTVTTAVSVAVTLLASATLRVTVYVPLSAYVCVGVRVPVVWADPSPQSQSYDRVPVPPPAAPVNDTADPSLAVWSAPASAVTPAYTVTAVE